MAVAEMETAADKYRRRDKKATLHTVTCDCGMEWQCRKYGLDFWVGSGVMPTELAAKYMTLAQQGKTSDEAVAAELNPTQVLQSLELSGKIVRMTAVSPAIVEDPRPGQNELGYHEVDECCFATLRNWQMRGGGQAESLSSFPQQ